MSSLQMHNATATTAYEPASAARTARIQIIALSLFFLLAALCMSHPAFAQATTTTTASGGDAAWTAVKSFIFGGWGLTIAAIGCAGALYTGFRRGLGEALVVGGIALAFFLVPALVIGVATAAKTYAS